MLLHVSLSQAHRVRGDSREDTAQSFLKAAMETQGNGIATIFSSLQRSWRLVVIEKCLSGKILIAFKIPWKAFDLWSFLWSLGNFNSKAEWAVPATSGHSSGEGRKLQLVMSLQACASAEDTSHREEFIANIQSKPTLFFSLKSLTLVLLLSKISLPPFYKPFKALESCNEIFQSFLFSRLLGRATGSC